MSTHASKSRSIAAFALGVGLVLAVGTKFAPESRDSVSPTPLAQDFVAAQTEDGEPCPGAVKTTEDDIAREGREFWLPSSDSLGPLQSAWMCSGTPTFDYSGITFAYEPGWKVDDAQGRWEAMAKQWGRGTVGTVLDRPAFILPVSELDPRGEVLVLIDGTLIRVLGNGKAPIEDLISAVNSIRIS